jgi:hypothetical protein
MLCTVAGTFGNKSFLDLMIEVTDEHKSFSEEDAIHELCTFMLAVCAKTHCFTIMAFFAFYF